MYPREKRRLLQWAFTLSYQRPPCLSGTPFQGEFRRDQEPHRWGVYLKGPSVAWWGGVRLNLRDTPAVQVREPTELSMTTGSTVRSKTREERIKAVCDFFTLHLPNMSSLSVCGVITSKTAEDQTEGCCEDFGYALGRVPHSKSLILHINSNVSLQGFSLIKNIPMRVFWGHCCAWTCCATRTHSQILSCVNKHGSI